MLACSMVHVVQAIAGAHNRGKEGRKEDWIWVWDINWWPFSHFWWPFQFLIQILLSISNSISISSFYRWKSIHWTFCEVKWTWWISLFSWVTGSYTMTSINENNEEVGYSICGNALYRLLQPPLSDEDWQQTVGGVARKSLNLACSRHWYIQQAN